MAAGNWFDKSVFDMLLLAVRFGFGIEETNKRYTAKESHNIIFRRIKKNFP